MTFLAEDHMTIEELRREVRRLWDGIEGLGLALNDLPEVLNADALRGLIELTGVGILRMPNVEGRAWAIQRQHGLSAVPPTAQAENAAVVWSVIRSALLVERYEYEVERAALPEASPDQGPIEPLTDC